MKSWIPFTPSTVPLTAAAHDEIGTIFAQLRIVFVDKGTHERIPEHINNTNYEEHGTSQSGRLCCITTEHIDIGVEEQQIHADGLVDEILGQVACAEADAL